MASLERDLKELDALRDRGVITAEEYDVRRAALMAAVSASPPKRGNLVLEIFKWGSVGCLIVIGVAVVVVILFLMAVIAAVRNSKDNTDDSGADVRVILATGASGEISPEGQGRSRQRVTILEIDEQAETPNGFQVPRDGYRFWGARVRVENIGERQTGTIDWTLRTTAGVEYDRLVATGDYQDLVYNDLSPGSAREGWIYFEIPDDAAVDWVRADPAILAAYDLYFDAP